MSATFRFIHLELDPLVGARFPLGAVVTDARGRVQVARAGHLPSAECVGRSFALSAQRLVQRLGEITQADSLPPVFGPYTRLGEVRPLPASVVDPVRWLEAMMAGPPKVAATETRAVKRATLGYKFFKTWKVDGHVRKTFQPDHDLDGWLARYSMGLNPVSHWVANEQQVDLMEPIVASRSQLDADLKKVGQHLLAWRQALAGVNSSRRGELVVYLPAGGKPELREQAMQALKPFADRVVDTEDDSARTAFLERIRTVAMGPELAVHG